MRRTRAASILAAVKGTPADAEEVELKAFAEGTAIKAADVDGWRCLVLERADGITLLLEVLKAQLDVEFKPVEAASGGAVNVFFPVLKDSLSVWAASCERLPSENDDFVKLSRAVRLLEQDKAEALYKSIVLERMRERSKAKVEELRAVVRARGAAASSAAATAGTASAVAAAAAAAAADAPPASLYHYISPHLLQAGAAPPPAYGALQHQPVAAAGNGFAPGQPGNANKVPGTDGKTMPWFTCRGCRKQGHVQAKCPTATAGSAGGGGSSASSGASAGGTVTP